MAQFKETDKTGYIARNLAAPKDSTLKSPTHYTVTVAINATSTAAAATNWRNPHGTSVLAKASVWFLTAGTGTIDVGTGTAGTGASNAFIDGGTMAAGFLTRHTTGTDGVGVVGETAGWLTLGGSGSGGDTVVLSHSDTPTSTAVGYLLVEILNPSAQ